MAVGPVAPREELIGPGRLRSGLVRTRLRTAAAESRRADRSSARKAHDCTGRFSPDQ